MLLVGIGFGFALGSHSHWTPSPSQEASEAVNIDAVVEQIISVESNGDPNAKNKRSSAMGLGQFLDETNETADEASVTGGEAFLEKYVLPFGIAQLAQLLQER
jgi:hypothetical protein